MKCKIKVLTSSLGLLLVLNLFACREELRGDVLKSPDGKTYLVFEEACDSVYVNGIVWSYKLGVKGEVPAGTCVIGCGSDRIDWLSINIDEGTTFHFDYWGP